MSGAVKKKTACRVWCYLCEWLCRRCRPQRPPPPLNERVLPRIVLKLRQGAAPPYVDGAEQYLPGKQREMWQSLSRRYPGISLNPVYSSVDVEDLRRITAVARERDSTFNPEFETYFQVVVPKAADDPDALLKDIVAVFGADIQSAYVDRPARPPGPVRTPAMGQPCYVQAAPTGVDAEYAWAPPQNFNGGVLKPNLIPVSPLSVAILDKGWWSGHTNLPPAEFIAGDQGITDDAEKKHGDEVMSIVAGHGNPQDITGISPNAKLYFGCTIAKTNNVFSTDIENAIIAATARLKAGDVILVEEQGLPVVAGQPQEQYVPAESKAAVFNAIRAATLNDIVVVEPAGNRPSATAAVSETLDSADLSRIDGTLYDGRTNASFNSADSGAIVVSAVHAPTAQSSGTSRQRMATVNHGLRVDCYAWGESVMSSGFEMDELDDPYEIVEGDLGMTSAASAIVAGVILLMQHMAIREKGRVLSPNDVRSLVRRADCGTPVVPDLAGGAKRFMPDLKNLHSAIKALP